MFKLYNDEDNGDDWMDINFNQYFNNRCDKIKFFDVSKTKIGRNLLSNRIATINLNIEYEWLNKSWNTYKLKGKSLFLT